MFLVELLIIMILLLGINTYTSQYGSITFDKTTSANKNSISAPVNSAFTHLFTWLIIFNTLLIVFIIVKMVSKYYKLTDPSQQQEGENEEEATGQ
jgi:ABC-type Fe3+ transport system permease subunit